MFKGGGGGEEKIFVIMTICYYEDAVVLQFEAFTRSDRTAQK